MSEPSVTRLTDAFMAAWNPRGGDVASEHAVESMKSALTQTGWLNTREGECSCGTDATSLNLAEVVVHRNDEPCYITLSTSEGDD